MNLMIHKKWFSNYSFILANRNTYS